MGDIGSLLLGVFRASKHEQETLGAIGSNMKQQEAAAVYSPTTNLGYEPGDLVVIKGDAVEVAH